MKIKSFLAGATLSIAGLLAASSSTYIIDEKEQAVITRFGQPVRIIVGSTIGKEDNRYKDLMRWNEKEKAVGKISSGAGLYFKLPLIETVNRFEDRVIEYDSAPTDVVTKDKNKIRIDNYARFVIKNPLKFMQTVLSEAGARARLDDIIYSVVREEIGQNNLIEVVRTSNDPIQTTEKREFEHISKGRAKILEDITRSSNEKSEQYGIEILDVRIKRADLPEENVKSVYGRMTAERNRMATKYRSQGEEQAMKIRAETDMQKTIILTEAYKSAEQIKGQGDAEALKIYAEAYSKNPNFFKLWRTLDSYETAFDSKTKVILSSDTEFNKYLINPRP